MTKPSWKSSEGGFGIVALVILAAFVFAALNVYSYYNPSFSLAPYSPLNYFKEQHDQQRIKDLKTLQTAVEAYFQDTGKVPASPGWCGTIYGIIHPDFKYAVAPYLKTKNFPSDPASANTDHDYFYANIDGLHYALMAVLELPKTDTSKYNYNFKNCHDWPGDNVYNYQINNFGN